MEKYTKVQNALYWAITSVFVGVGISIMMVLFAFVEYITA